MVHTAAVSKEITGAETAELFLAHVFRHHGLPVSIVSDRDPRFTSAFWKALFERLGTSLRMSTADHPQSDGQTERANRVVEDILRSHCTRHPRDWSTMLPFVDFAINNSVHASTGHTPFYLNGLRHPRVPSTLFGDDTIFEGGEAHATNVVDVPETVTDSLALDAAAVKQLTAKERAQRRAALKAAQASHDFVTTRAAVITNVRYLLAEAQDRQKYYADQHSRANKNIFKVSDKVLLSTKNIFKDKVEGDKPKKLLPRYIGPFTVLDRVGELDYKLDIPRRMQLHSTFYVGVLKKYEDTDLI
jgi:hypothetical protein